MKISKEEVLHVADLARLKLSDSEAEALTKDMESIMALMDSIKDVDIKAEDYPLSFPGEQKNLRADEICSSLPVDEALANVPDRKFHFIAVKKIIGE